MSLSFNPEALGPAIGRQLLPSLATEASLEERVAVLVSGRIRREFWGFCCLQTGHRIQTVAETSLKLVREKLGGQHHWNGMRHDSRPARGWFKERVSGLNAALEEDPGGLAMPLQHILEVVLKDVFEACTGVHHPGPKHRPFQEDPESLGGGALFPLTRADQSP
ncbi:hypothetical protein GWK47_055156 [Chionoecetes opilio]|uniref:Uncharacterized protein n=1 Tax=Chionoecetes opilio TaxID=41210 RepID=A0A8J4XZ90_CHIOP|nr:hypothetical protein GWK47_055156 [Chionoecetes opilio]